jgi:ribosomal protein S18 acetylase RimI-like enzyme
MRRAEGAGFVIEEACEHDEIARLLILHEATQELRRVYRPRSHLSRCSTVPSEIFVAKVNGDVIGTVSCVIRDDDLYVQELAVRPAQRKRGVCRALLSRAVETAMAGAMNTVTLCVIEETGNAAIFQKMGFSISRRSIAPGHVGADGAAVTQVDMRLLVPASITYARRSQ